MSLAKPAARESVVAAERRTSDISPDQEHLLGEVLLVERRPGRVLRFATIPTDELRGLPCGEELTRISSRAREHLQRSLAEWQRRGGDSQRLARCLTELTRGSGRTGLGNVLTSSRGQVQDLSTDRGGSEVIGRTRQKAGREATDSGRVLLLALAVERVLVGESRTHSAAVALVAELDRQLEQLDRAFPATPLALLDVQRAVRLARDEMTRAFTYLARRRAAYVAQFTTVPAADLSQTGVEALLHAIDRFDVRYGVPFEAYASQWVKSAIDRADRLADIVSLPTSLKGLRPRVRRVLAEHEGWTDPEVAAELELDTDVVTFIRRAVAGSVSLDGEGDEPGPQISGDTDEPEAFMEIAECRSAVRRALALCPPREREILTRYYGIGCEPEHMPAIAKSLGLTPQRLSQLKKVALRRLRRPATRSLLEDFAA